MDITIKKNKSGISMTLKGDLSIYSVKDAKKSFFENLDKCQELEIDLSGVDKMDTAGFQLLSLVKREAEQSKKAFKMIKPAHEVKRIFNLYGEVI